MTHIENIPHIIQYGVTHPASKNRNPTYISIGDPSLIEKRNTVTFSNGRQLGDYVPFYFGVRMPMLYVIQKGFNNVAQTNPESIVYCISSVQKIIDLNLDFIFTDGHAKSKISSFYDQRDIARIDKIVDFQAINASLWKSMDDLDLKRRKEAEFLILGNVPYEGILGFAVFSSTAQLQLKNFGISADKIVIRPAYYF